MTDTIAHYIDAFRMGENGSLSGSILDAYGVRKCGKEEEGTYKLRQFGDAFRKPMREIKAVEDITDQTLVSSALEEAMLDPNVMREAIDIKQHFGQRVQRFGLTTMAVPLTGALLGLGIGAYAGPITGVVTGGTCVVYGCRATYKQGKKLDRDHADAMVLVDYFDDIIASAKQADSAIMQYRDEKW